MLISTKGRYALRVVLDLAQHAGDGYVSLKSVAERQDVSVKYLESIVALLQKGGVLTSQRGTQGGYRLACPASELSVYEIVRLTEGSLAPVTCLEDFDPSVGCVCSRAGVCLTLPLWQGLERRVVEYLSGVTVQDLLDGRALDQKREMRNAGGLLKESPAPPGTFPEYDCDCPESARMRGSGLFFCLFLRCDMVGGGWFPVTKGGLPSLSPACPAFCFDFAPYPPDPLPRRGRGRL